MKTVVLLGPTASGKTKLSLELAKKIDGEIISADSMQVYRGMNIGTAKPTLEERQGIPHHLIDIKGPDEEWTVSDFVEQVNKLVPGIVGRGKRPIVVGGTGLYLWSWLEGYSFPDIRADKELREQLNALPASTLHAQLSTVDPAAAAKINPNDKKRLVRALEVFKLTGKRISELQERAGPNSPQLIVGNQVLLVGLSLPRELLYSRINQRVDEMLAKGLVAEVKGLLAKGYPKELPAFQALGYKEVIKYFDRQKTLDIGRRTLDEEIKIRTRNFAKRQLTWFKRFKDVKWFEPPIDIMAVLDYIK